MAETDVWVEMIEETRQALAELREEDLEALALRAERAFEIAEDAGHFRGLGEVAQSGDPVNAGIRSTESLRELAASHRMLGEVLDATASNIAVLRRLRDGETHPRWGR
jgi:hypothetical protein